MKSKGWCKKCLGQGWFSKVVVYYLAQFRWKTKMEVGVFAWLQSLKSSYGPRQVSYPSADE